MQILRLLSLGKVTNLFQQAWWWLLYVHDHGHDHSHDHAHDHGQHILERTCSFECQEKMKVDRRFLFQCETHLLLGDDEPGELLSSDTAIEKID